MASEAQRRANDKWREKFDEIRFRVPKGQKHGFKIMPLLKENQ